MSLVKSPLFSPALLCALCSVAFTFGEGSVSWLWRNSRGSASPSPSLRLSCGCFSRVT